MRTLLTGLFLVMAAAPMGLAADSCWRSSGWGAFTTISLSSSRHHHGHGHGWGWSTGIVIPLVWQRRSCAYPDHGTRTVVVQQMAVPVAAPAAPAPPAPVPAAASTPPSTSTSIDITPEAVHGPVVDTWIVKRPQVTPIMVNGVRAYSSGWHETRWVRYRDGFSEPR